jgi:hypothetical protein
VGFPCLSQKHSSPLDRTTSSIPNSTKNVWMRSLFFIFLPPVRETTIAPRSAGRRAPFFCWRTRESGPLFCLLDQLRARSRAARTPPVGRLLRQLTMTNERRPTAAGAQDATFRLALPGATSAGNAKDCHCRTVGVLGVASARRRALAFSDCQKAAPLPRLTLITRFGFWRSRPYQTCWV